MPTKTAQLPTRAKLFLFGTDHRLQCGGPNCLPTESAAFVEEISHVCRAHGVKRISEEMSADGLTRHGVLATNTCTAASSLGLPHEQVDLDMAEQYALGLFDAALLSALSLKRQPDGGGRLRARIGKVSDEVRERVWALRILRGDQWPVLLVLGADHINSFQRVWNRLRVGGVEVVHQNYGDLR